MAPKSYIRYYFEIMCLVLFLPSLCKVCSRVSEAFLLALSTLSNSSSDTKAFLHSLHSQAPQQQYIVHCMHYAITLWAYLSEPLIKRQSQMSKFDGKATIPCAQVMWSHHCVCVTKKYMETLHVNKMADLVAVYNASNFWTKQFWRKRLFNFTAFLRCSHWYLSDALSVTRQNRENGHTYRHTHTHIHTHRTTTVSFAAHAHQGLIMHPEKNWLRLKH